MHLTSVSFLLALLTIFTTACSKTSNINNLNTHDRDNYSDGEEKSEMDVDFSISVEPDNEKEDLESSLPDDNEISNDDEINDSDSDADKSLCNPNPCKFKNKSVCNVITKWGKSEERYYCSCDEGWFGPRCEECQRGFYGEFCKPCDCKRSEICNDGIKGDGTCSCIIKTEDEKCGCMSGWSGDNCTEFGKIWACADANENCEDINCCYNSSCIHSFKTNSNTCVPQTRYDSESGSLTDTHSGNLIASVRSGFIYLYDIDSLDVVNILGEGSTSSIDFSPDGSSLAAVLDTCLYIYDLKTGEKQLIDCGLNYCQEVEFSPDGTMLAATNWSGFHVYKLKSGRYEDYFSASFEDIAAGINTYSVSFSPDSSLIASGAGLSSNNENIQIYDLNKKELSYKMPLYEYYARSDFSEDGRYIAVGGHSLDGAIDGWFEDPAYIYNCSDWSLKEHIGYIRDSVSHLEFNYSGDYLLMDNVVYRVGGYFFPFISDHSSLIFSQNGQNMIAINKGALYKYSVPGFKFLASGHKNGGRRHFFSNNGKNVISFTSSFEVVFNDSIDRTESKRFEMEDLNQQYLRFRISDNDEYSLSYADDYYRRKGFFITDLGSGHIIYSESEIMAQTASFSPEDNVFSVFDGLTSTTYIRTLPSGDLVFNIEHYEDESVNHSSFSPDGQALALGFEDKTVIYDLKTRKSRLTIPFSGQISFFPDSSKIIISDFTSRIFSMSDGSEILLNIPTVNSEHATVTNDLKYIIFNSGIFDIESSETSEDPVFYYFSKVLFNIDEVNISPDNSTLFFKNYYSARVVDAKNLFDNFKVACHKDSDCKSGFFCNTKKGRCFNKTYLTGENN